MKEIMANMSTWTECGTPSFGCSPKSKVISLLDSIDPVPDLADDLLTTFAGQNLTVAKIYLGHGLEKPYTSGQYKAALKQLELEGIIIAVPPAL